MNDQQEEKVKLPIINENIKPLSTGKYHISFSEMMDWVECSWRHKLKHIDNIEGFVDNEHTLYGKIVHDAIENYVLGKTQFDFVSTSEKVRETLKTLPSFEGDIEKWAESIKPIFDEFPDFLKENFLNYNVIDAEHQLQENIIGKNNRFFKGYIDLVLSCDEIDKANKTMFFDKMYWILDYKTTDWGWSGQKKRDEHKQMQMILYKHFWSNKTGTDPNKIHCAWILLKRTAKPGKHIELVPVNADEKATEKALNTVNRMIVSLEKKIYTKNRNSCMFCPYSNTEHCT